MPVLIAIVVLSAVAGLLAPRAAAAYFIAGGLAVFANAAFAWAIADGKGDDPAWLLALSIVGGAVAVAAAHATIKLRRRLTARAASAG